MIIDNCFTWMIKNFLLFSVMLLLVLALRKTIGKKSGKAMCVLWGIVALRLLSPFYIYTPISIVDSSWVSEDKETVKYKNPFEEGIDSATEKELLNKNNTSTRLNSFSSGGSYVFFKYGKYIWLIGTGLVLIFGTVRYFKTKSRLREALFNNGIMICDGISTALVFGIIKPKIFIPSFIEEKHKSSVLLHENIHITRRDNLKKFVGFVITALYWYNPLIWISYYFFERDIEIACDTKAIEKLDETGTSDYIDALLYFSTYKSMVFTYNSLFSGNRLKERIEAIKTVRRNKQANILTIIGIVIICFIFFFAKADNSKGATFYDNYSEEDRIIALEYYPEGYTGYYYPSLPQMSNWPYGNFRDIYSVCQISEKELKKMSTDELVQTVAAYPLWSEMYLYDSKKEGYQAIKNKFNGLAELCLRKEANDSLLKQRHIIEEKYPIAYNALSKYLLDEIL